MVVSSVGLSCQKHPGPSVQELKQAISAREWALCKLIVCFEIQSRSDRRKGHKSFALEMVFRRKVRR